MPNAATKHRCHFMACASFRFWRAIRIGRGAGLDGRAAHVATDSDAAAVCLDTDGCRLLNTKRRRLGSFRVRRFLGRSKMAKAPPNSGPRTTHPPSNPPPPLAEAGAGKARPPMIRIPAAKPPAIRLCNLIMIRLLSSRRRQSTPSLLRWLRGPKSGSSAPFAPRRRGRASVTPYSLCTTSSPGREAVHRLNVVLTDPPPPLARRQADSRAWRARKWWKSRGLLPVVRACARQGVLPRNRGKAQYLRDRKPTPSLCFSDPGATRRRPGPGGHSAVEATPPLSGHH